MKRQIISILMENKPGAFSRISEMFSMRGYNIDSLSVGEITGKAFSRMTITVRCDDKLLEQIFKQLNKLVNVIKVHELGEMDFVERELVIMKVAMNSSTRSELLDLANIFHAQIVHYDPKSLTLELTENAKRIEAFVEAFLPYGIQDMARSGTVALATKSLTAAK
jgi:acetolactate synthase-1/3 small subunit